MKDDRWFTYVAAGIAITVVVGFGAGLGLGGFVPSGHSGPSAPSSSSTVDHLYLTVAWNPTSGLDEYFPANFTVPAHTLVEFTITSYDNGSNTVPAMYATVRGVVGNAETITYASSSHVVSSLPPTGITHTFTMMNSGMMGSGMGAGGMMNAVIPPSISADSPVTVTFGAFFNTSGAWAWNCMAPCDPGAMTTAGLMTGTVTVD